MDSQEHNFCKLTFLTQKDLIGATFSPSDCSHFWEQVVNFVWKIRYITLWSSSKISYALSRNVYVGPLK